MRAQGCGQRGGIGILLCVLLVALVLFVAYQVGVKGQHPPVATSQAAAAATGQIETTAEQALTTVTETVNEAALEPGTQPSFQEQVQIPSPRIHTPLNSAERPVMKPPSQPVQLPVRPLPIKEVKNPTLLQRPAGRFQFSWFHGCPLILWACIPPTRAPCS